MPSGRAHPSAGQSCERLRRAAGALAAEGDVAPVARDKTVLETARETVSAAPRRRVIAVSCDTGDDQSVRETVPAVTDGLAEICRAIARGQALPGERLPPARDLAAVPRMNRNTVSRALRLLRDEGLPEFRRGHGTTMAGTPQRGVVLTQARELVRLARQHGYHRDKLIQNIEACRGPLWPTRGADKVRPMGAMDR
jgi:GntR family transcriptional regulator